MMLNLFISLISQETKFRKIYRRIKKLNSKNMTEEITFEEFRKVDMRVGRVIEVLDFPEAKKPSYKLKIDFGNDIGIKCSSAQITVHKKEELLNKLVIAVVNFPTKKVANFNSEVLTLGVSDGKGSWIIIRPEREVELGTRVE